MSTPRVASADELDLQQAPLLGDRAPSLRGATRFLSSASSQHMLREPSIRVREATSEEIQHRLSVSKPLLAFALILCLAVVVGSFSVLALSRDEKAPALLRWWVAGVGLQCLLHMVCKAIMFQKRRASSTEGGGGEENPGGFGFEKLNYWNDMAGLILCVIGLYWVITISPDDAPRLYCVCVVIAVSGLIIPVIILAAAFVLGIGICCFLPCIIAILHASADTEGAKMEDIEKLPKFIFRRQNGEEGIMRECDTDSPVEQVIPAEDAECSICLDAYHDGAELRELPCRHRFHTACVDKWLCIKATCPLCKLNIGKHNDDQV